VKKLIEYRTANLRKYLYFMSGIVLLAGLGSAVAIYHSSSDYSRSAQAYEDDYPISPEDTKQYLRGLQLYGGTANVLADEFRNWFAGLWYGKSLAVTVAFISILLSVGIFYISYRLPER
jgi:hypothetical protein